MRPVPTIGIVNGDAEAPGLQTVIRDVVDSPIAPFDRILGTRLASRPQIWWPAANSDASSAGRLVRWPVSLDETLDRMKFIDPTSEVDYAARAVGATFGDSA
jgi:hypothetical protein